MGVLAVLTEVTGIPPGLEPRVIYIETDNTYAEVQEMNFLGNIVSSYGIQNNDIALVSGTDFIQGAPGSSWFSVIVTPVSSQLIPSSQSESAASLAKTVTQSAHGFSVGDVVYMNGSNYALAKADSASTTDTTVGIVTTVLTSSVFILTYGGHVPTLSGLTAGTVYYLSDSTAGLLTATAPTTVGHIVKPLLISDSTTTGYFFNFKGSVVNNEPMALNWYTVTADTNMLTNSAYYVTGSQVGPVILTLPATFGLYDEIRVMGNHAWTIAQNAGQSISVGSVISTVGTGGSVSSLANSDSIALRSVVANTTLKTEFGVSEDYIIV